MPDGNVIRTAGVDGRIYLIRGQRVLLDSDLARLYGVTTRRLNEQVKRNQKRFPAEFLLRLTRQEVANLKSHFATSSWGGIRRANPYAFTEQGIAMLSAVLKSPRAINVSIEIIRTFVKLRQLLTSNKELGKKLALLEKKYDHQFKVVFDAIRQIMDQPISKNRKIEFLNS